MKREQVLIIGAVALGPKVACRLKRLSPSTTVIMIDQDEHIAYGGCGIPYFISGEISSVDELVSTSFHMKRDEKFFEDAKGVKVLTKTLVTRINRKEQYVKIKDLKTGKEDNIKYDKLVIATGSNPIIPNIPGAQLKGVYYPTNLSSAIAIREEIAKGNVGNALVIGGGPIGCEMAEALSDLWGIETIIVEKEPHLLPGFLDETLARMVEKEMIDNGVKVLTNEQIKEIEISKKEDKTLKVITSKENFQVDMVICATGVKPNSELAKEAGLAIGPHGGILVNERLETSDPNIYAGGDAIECINLITGKYMYIPQGSLANRQGRVIATNIAGGSAYFKGVVGSFAVKVFGLSVATTGIPFSFAKNNGFSPVHVVVVQADKAHFYPSWELMYLDLVVDKKTRKILGIQGVCSNGDSLCARINAVAALLQKDGTIEDLSNLEIAYSPPFASAMDIINATANTAENTTDGLNITMDPDEFEKLFLENKDEEVICLDVRGPENATPYVERYGPRWINIPQEKLNRLMDEVPKDKKLLLMCNSGVRSYEALLQLKEAGIDNAFNIQGGMAALKRSGIIKD